MRRCKKGGWSLRHLKAQGQVVEPHRQAVHLRHRQSKRPYAVRKPRGYKGNEPGDLVQVDAVEVRSLP